MTELWIAPMFTLAGTIIGVSIPAIANIITGKVATKQAKSEKYEPFLRELMIYFVSPSRTVLISSKAQLDIEYIRTKALESSKQVEKFYNESIPSGCPLELLELTASISSGVSKVALFIELLISEDGNMREKILEMMESARKELEYDLLKLEKNIQRNFI